MQRAKLRMPPSTDPRDDLDLDEDVTRQTRDLDTGARWRMIAEMRGVDAIQLCEIAKILQENRRLDDHIEGRAGTGQHLLRFSKTCSVCASRSSPTIWPSTLSGIWPEEKNQRSATMPCE